MAEKSFFFGSSGGDRKYTSADWAEMIAALVTTGVFLGTENLKGYVTGADRVVRIKTGSGSVLGKIYVNKDEVTFSPTAAHATYDRYDRVVLKLDLQNTAKRVALQYKTGTPSATPTPPDLIRDADEHELSILKVKIRAGSTSIVADDLTDERDNSIVCGRSMMNVFVSLLNGSVTPEKLSQAYLPLAGGTVSGQATFSAPTVYKSTIECSQIIDFHNEDNFDTVDYDVRLSTGGSTSDLYINSNKIWNAGNQPKITVSADAPSNPSVNDIWIDI